MKKSLFFAIALVAGAMSMKAQTLDTTQIDGIWYILDRANKTATVTYGPATGEAGMWGGIGQDTYSGRLIIPEYLNMWDAQEGSIQYPVVAIGDNAFSWCSNLSAIVIPKTVQTLGLNLLQRTSGVNELKIEDGDSPIYFRSNQGEYGEEISFQELAYSCTYLYLGRNVEVISDQEWASPVFHTWSAIEEAVIGAEVTEIPQGFCQWCRNIRWIQVNTPFKLTYGIGMLMFLEQDRDPNPAAITLYVPEGMASAYAADSLWSRFNIQEMDITRQYGIRYVDYTFDFYESGLYYKVSQKEEGSGDLYLSVALPQVWYLNPDGSYVSTWSSEFPYKQSSIVIPDSVTFYSFSNSSGTKYSAAPLEGWTRHRSAVEEIGEYCFRGASNLSSLTIPSTVKYIGTEAFEYTDKLFSLDIPESVEKVGWLAFARTGLKEVVIPASSSNWLDSDAAFQDNENLVKATFAPGTTAIQDRIFFGCVALRTIIIPDEVEYIGPGAFAG
ncbi:MAG: leucine-rich repeat protein, partial [Paludibacteraceae bacterium]|nr:leucine-rich repeat protein [Paludibacteraceae bacterium]